MISVYYFDDIGVPTNERMIKEHGSTEKWQEWVTHRWIERMYSTEDKKLIFLEGSFYPEFAIGKMQELGIRNYLIICLSAERSARDKRLIEGRKQPELATMGIVVEHYDQAIRTQTLKAGGAVVDSSNKEVSEILEETLSFNTII